MASHIVAGATAAASSPPFSSLTVKRDVAQTLSPAGARGNAGTLQQARAGGAASKVAESQIASPKLVVGDKQMHRSPSSGDRRGSGLSTPLGPLSNYAAASNNHHVLYHAHGDHTQGQAQNRAGTPLQGPSHVVTGGGGKAAEASMTTAGGGATTPAPGPSQPFGLGLKLDQSTSSTTSSIAPAPTAPLHIKKRSTTAPASALHSASTITADSSSLGTPFPDFSAPELADPSASLVSGFSG